MVRRNVFCPCGASETKRGRALEKLTRACASWSEFEPRSSHGPWSFRSFGFGSWTACLTWFPVRLLRVHPASTKPVLNAPLWAVRYARIQCRGGSPRRARGKAFSAAGGRLSLLEKAGGLFRLSEKKKGEAPLKGASPGDLREGGISSDSRRALWCTGTWDWGRPDDGRGRGWS